jgi:hypothetical protein
VYIFFSKKPFPMQEPVESVRYVGKAKATTWHKMKKWQEGKSNCGIRQKPFIETLISTSMTYKIAPFGLNLPTIDLVIN